MRRVMRRQARGARPYWPRMPEPARNAYRPGLCVCIPVGPADLPELAQTLRSLAAARRIPGGTRLCLLPGVEPGAVEPFLPADSGGAVEFRRCAGEQPLGALLECTGQGEADVLFLRPGMQLPPAVDCRLRWAAYRDERVGIAAPLATQGRSLVVPSQLVGQYAAQVSLAEFDRFLLGLAEYRSFSAAAPHPGCFYLRHKGLELLCRHPSWVAEEAGQTLAAMVRQLREAGLDTVVCDHLAVAGCCAEEASALAWIEATEEGKGFLDLHPLAPLASRAHVLLREQQRPRVHPGPPLQPVILHLGHSWGGGLDRWIADYAAADRAAHHLVLRSIGNWGAFGQSLALYAQGPAGTLIEEHGLGRPIRATEVTHARYRDILADIIERHAIDAVFVSSLIGHSFDALEFDRPTFLICHDYYPFCPALNISFGGVCSVCDAERLERCFASNEHNRFFRNVDAGDWVAIRARFAAVMQQREIPLVAPSASVIRNLRRLDPRLGSLPTKVISHGMQALPWIEHPQAKRSRLRVLLLGHLTLNKGKRLLLDALPALSAEAEFYLLGCGQDCDELRSREGVVEVVERYERERLPDLVRAIQPDLGLLLSVVPETFSYTLSELTSLGIPVLATRVGSFEDRIEDGKNGFLCEPDVRSVVDKLHLLNRQPEMIEPIRKRLRRQVNPSPEAMVAAYWELVPLHGFSYASYSRRDHGLAGEQEGSPVTPLRNIKHMGLPFTELVRQLQELIGEKIDTSPRLSNWQRRLLKPVHRGLAFCVDLLLKLVLRSRGGSQRRAG